MFFWCSANCDCDVTFKITNKLKVNTNNFKLNSNFKSHITVKRTLEKHLTFLFYKIYVVMT